MPSSILDQFAAFYFTSRIAPMAALVARHRGNPVTCLCCPLPDE